jgi:hypothetical protein
MRRRFNQNEFQGLGVYQRSSRGHNVAYGQNYERYNPGNVFESMSAYEMVGGLGEETAIPGFTMPNLGDLSAIPGIGQILQVVSQNGLQAIAAQVKGAAVIALEYLDYSADSGGPSDPIMGKAFPVASMTSFLMSKPWVEDLVKYGWVVMFSIRNLSGANTLKIMATQVPQTVAANAKIGGEYVIIDGPQAIIDQAAALLTPAPLPVPVPVPVPTPPPGGGQLAPPDKAGLPGWVVPVAIVGGGVLLLAVAYSLMKKSKGSASAISYTSY